MAEVLRNKSYTSNRLCFFFSCESDEAALNKIMKNVRGAIKTPRSKFNGNAFIGADNEDICPVYHEDVRHSDAAEVCKPNALLHTLHHGTIEIGIMIFFCRVAASELLLTAIRIPFSACT